MPQPLISIGLQLRFSSHILAERPVCAIKIAIVGSAWATLESRMVSAFDTAVSDVTRTTSEDLGDGYTAIPNPIGRATIDTIESLRTRLEVIQAVIAITLPTDLQTEFAELAKRVRKCASARNQIVHGLWGIADKYPEDVILADSLMTSGVQYVRHTPQDFDDVANRIVAVINAMRDFERRCRLARSELRPPKPTVPAT